MSLDETQPGSQTLLDERTQVSTDDGDHDRFAHYVKKHEILESAVSGKPIRAICGKKWVPSRDPDKYPLCPVCKAIYDKLPPGDGGSDQQ